MHNLFRIYIKLCQNGNYFNSREKRQNLNLFHGTLKVNLVTRRFLSKLIGKLLAAFPAVRLGQFYYRSLEMDKTKTLRLSNGDYDAAVRLPRI